MKPTKLDWEIIESRVNNFTDFSRSQDPSISFLCIALQQIYPSISDEFHEVITDGPGDLGIDAVYIIDDEIRPEIVIGQSKYRRNYQNHNKTINENEIYKITRFLQCIFNKDESMLNEANEYVKQAILSIWDLVSQGKICQYKIILFSNDAGISNTASQRLEEFAQQNPQVTYEHYGIRDFLYHIQTEKRKIENGHLQVIGKEIFERSDGEIRGAIASVDAKSFVRLITYDDIHSVKRYIFDDNLRRFLGEKSGYNPNIISTATSEQSHLFWYFNNGITITCKHYEFNKGQANTLIRLEDYQIVNGAQTSHSLIEAMRQAPDQFENVVLLVRIYATTSYNITQRVAVATNSQARIQSRDLRANENIMKLIESGLSNYGYFFERKKNMHTDKPESRRVDALKLGQIVLSYELREPDKAKTESNTIFDTRFRYIFNEERPIKHLINLVELYRVIEKKRDEYNIRYGNGKETEHNHSYLNYGHWFVLFTCSLIISQRKIPEIPTGDEADSIVEAAITIVSKVCSQKKAVAHYQMFRSPKTREKIIDEFSGKQMSLFESFFLTTDHPGQRMSD